jgi:hypothetical protein
VVLCGLGIGVAAFHRGMKPQHSGGRLGRHHLRSRPTLFVLVVHFAFAFLESEARGTSKIFENFP